MSNKDFVSILVDETFELQKSGEMALSSLELKLQDYSLEFLKGEFVPQAQILRFHTPFGDLDVPVNWSIFSVNNTYSDFILLDQHNDQDCFFSVMKTTWNQSLEKLLVIHADGFCYLVGLKIGEDAYLHDLLNPQELLKAA